MAYLYVRLGNQPVCRSTRVTSKLVNCVNVLTISLTLLLYYVLFILVSLDTFSFLY